MEEFNRKGITNLTGNLDKLRGERVGDPENIENFNAIGTTRNITFVMLEGDEVFLSYAYLVKCKYSVLKSTITMQFTTCEVVLTGRDLKKLFHDLEAQLPKTIRVIEMRYASLIMQGETVVTSIEIFDNE